MKPNSSMTVCINEMSEEHLENNKKLGVLFIKGREKLSLSQQDIASRLNLKKEIITALDAGDFDKLPVPIYVRGYIRSYARAVHLDENNLIGIYEGSVVASSDVLPDIKYTVQASSKNKLVEAVTYLLIFILIIFIMAWWQGQYFVGMNSSAIEIRASSGGEYQGGFSYSYDIITHPETQTLVEPDKTPTELDSNDLKDVETLDLVKHEDLDPADVVLTEDPNPWISPYTVGDLATLNIELTAESWIEVYDVAGETLYFNLGKIGEKINIRGIAPLSVKLGNARAVSVYFNGKIFNIKEYTKLGVAHFSLE